MIFKAQHSKPVIRFPLERRLRQRLVHAALQYGQTTRPLRCLLLGLILSVSALAHGQQVPPPGMTFTCAPVTMYINNSATCTVHVGGEAAGSVNLFVRGVQFASGPLDTNGDASFSTGSFAPGLGQYAITALYVPSANSNYSSAQATAVLAVYYNQVIVTAETLTCSPYVLLLGNTATCSVNVPGGATGTVTFTWGTNGSATATLDGNGNATVSGVLAGINASGSYTIQAGYSGDNNFAGFATTTVETISNTKMQPASMKVGCTPYPVAVGAPGSCAVQLTGGATGNVSLFVNNQFINTLNLDSTGAATFPNLFATLAAGSSSVEAFYSGDDNFASASAGTTVSVVSGEDSSPLTVTCTPSAPSLGQPTNCTASLPPGATGSVQFTEAGSSWSTVALNAQGTATATGGLQGYPIGTYVVSASYAGDGNFTPQSGSASVSVSNQLVPPPGMSFTCAQTALMLPVGTTCTATVGGNATGALLFYINGDMADGAGLSTNGQALFQNELAYAPVGTYQLTATYLGDLNYAPATVGSVIVTVAPYGTKSNPTITASVNPIAIQSGGQLSYTANVSSGATGAVAVAVNGIPVATLELNADGTITGGLNLALPNGSYPVSFSYQGDLNFNPVLATATLIVSAQAPANPTEPPTSGGSPAACPVSSQ